MNIREKALKLFQDNVLSNCSYGTDDLSVDRAIDTMIEFAQEMCEEQKKLCSKNSKLLVGWGGDYSIREDVSIKEIDGQKVEVCVNSQSILNTKNVCEI